jgi:hypothetical protein
MKDWKNVAKENGIGQSTFLSRISRGWEVERAATEPTVKAKTRSDYKWLKKANKNGISSKVYKQRVDEYGWHPKKAASVLVKSRNDKNWLKIAVQNGIHRDTFYYRVDELFWTPEEAATTLPLTKIQSINNAAELLKEYREIEHERIYNDPNNLFKITPQHYKIAKENGISRGTVRSRIHKLGWTVIEAISVPVKIIEREKEYYEYLEKAKQNGISTSAFIYRVKRNWTLEEAALRPLVNPKIRRRNDKDWIEVALQNGLNYSVYLHRVEKLGWTPQEAATTKVLPKGKFLNEHKRENSLKAFQKFKKG